jgi:dinuclear metal center YbgI/SA1388 family protein
VSADADAGPAGASVTRDALVGYLDGLLAVAGAHDYGPNGLQVEGRAEIRRIVSGVSACEELLVAARARGADAVLVHHGLFWSFVPATLVGYRYRRVRELIAGEMSLLAYHLPLDSHAELGNNALAARALGLYRLAPFGRHEGQDIGWRGIYPEPLAVEELVGRCRDLYLQEPLLLGGGPPRVASVGIVSGGAQRELYQAIEAGLDAYITGEASEWVLHTARENGIWYLACGHYATERLGIRALGEHVAARFGIAHEFVDIPNPV